MCRAYTEARLESNGLWPTPTTQETEHLDAELNRNGRRKTKDGKDSHSLGLADAVRLFPTPTSREYKGGRKPETLAAVGRNATNSLSDAVNAMYPTPQARDWKGAQGRAYKGIAYDLPSVVGIFSDCVNSEETEIIPNEGGQLNPDWVEWLMGFAVGWTDVNLNTSVLSPPACNGEYWPDEPNGVPRIAYGIENRVNRLKCLGNAVVPQQFYPIFKAIYEIQYSREAI